MAKAKGLLEWIGRSVDELMKMGYPESVAKRISSGELPMDEASRLARAAEQGFDPTTFYKGLHPYPNVKSSDLGALAILEGKSFPAITEIQRQGPFPSFGGKDGDIPAGVIAGFYSPDHKVSNYFAPYQGSATYPLKARLGRVKEFDAAGKKAGQLQFGDAGKDFRDAARSGEYDTIILRNTADEGDVHISLNAENIRSPFAAFDPEYTGPNILGSRIAPTAAAGLLGAMALTQSEDAEAGKFSIDDLKYLYKQAKDGNEGALKWLMDDSGLDAADTLRRVENKIAKADRVTPTGDLTPTPEPDLSYRGSHRAPDADYGAPLHDLTEMIPEDIYGPKGQQYYGYGDPAVDREVFDAVRKARGNPDLEVPIYRAVPEGVDKINTGDWVTTSKEYARQHGENALGGKYSILEDVAPAKKLQSEGYPYEFGLLPALSAMAIGLGTSGDVDAAALEAGMPMAMQAGGQSAMDAKPDLGRDVGTLIGLLDFLLPFAAEFAKPATMGNAELTEEQRRQRKYYGQ